MGLILNDHSYIEMRKYLASRKDFNEVAFWEFNGAWNALIYRHQACVEAHQSYTEAIKEYGESPESPFRYQQERELFHFFVDGLSVIETICYGVYAIGSLLEAKDAELMANDFPIATEEDRKHYNITDLRNKFCNKFPDDEVSKKLNRLTKSKQYKKWHVIRNNLSHRTSPGRIFYSGDSPKSATWIFGTEIDSETTEIRLAWLDENVEKLLDSLQNFVYKYFDITSPDKKFL